MYIFAAYVRVRMDRIFFYNCIVHLLSLRQQNHHFFLLLTTQRRNKVFMSMWAWAVVFILSCRRVVVPVV